MGIIIPGTEYADAEIWVTTIDNAFHENETGHLLTIIPFRMGGWQKDESWRSMNAIMHRPEKPKFGEPSVIVVHDLDEDQWRSFDPSRVVGITQ